MVEKQIKTGTTTVCIVCKDGIVLAADKRVTAGYVVNKNVRKIIKITDKIAVTIAGSVSEVQLLTKLVRAELKLKDVQTKRISSVKEAANLLAGIVYNNFRRNMFMRSVAAFIMAGADDDGFHAFELGVDGSLMKVDDYSADGSGSIFAIGMLESGYKKSTVQDGIKLAIKAINTAIQRDIYSGNGVNVLTVTNKGAEHVMEQKLEAHLKV
jgi:proteasome beta subunit